MFVIAPGPTDFSGHLSQVLSRVLSALCDRYVRRDTRLEGSFADHFLCLINLNLDGAVLLEDLPSDRVR